MATDQVAGVASGATGTPLSGITGTLQGTTNRVVKSGQSLLDRILPLQRREEVKSKVVSFSTERPLLASFIFSQIALSGLPVALFVIMTIIVGISALLAGLIVGLIGVLVFIVGTLMVALFILLPTLVFTTFFAIGIWLWIVAAYYIVKAFNEKKVPGIHVPLEEGLLNLPSAYMQQKHHNGSSNGSTKHLRTSADYTGEMDKREAKTFTGDAVTQQDRSPHNQMNQIRGGHEKELNHKKNAKSSVTAENAAISVSGVADGFRKQVM